VILLEHELGTAFEASGTGDETMALPAWGLEKLGSLSDLY
jgi:hypothetical protein